jgi:DNA-binding transcriptional regulator YiaG
MTRLSMTGAQLRAIRRSLGFTQEALAGHLAVTANTVARWERDEVRITPAMVRLIQLVADQPPRSTAPRERHSTRGGKKGRPR